MLHRLILGLHLNSAKSAMWSDDHSGEGRAVSFLKLSSSKSSNNESTVNESAETETNMAIIKRISTITAYNLIQENGDTEAANTE